MKYTRHQSTTPQKSITLNSFNSKKNKFLSNEFLCSLACFPHSTCQCIEKSTLNLPCPLLCPAPMHFNVTDGKRRIQDPREDGGVPESKNCAL
jgi:hypothetical protein